MSSHPARTRQQEKTKKPKDGFQDKKARPNKFHVFGKMHRERLKEENPTIDGAAVRKLISDMWKGLTDEEKDKYKVDTHKVDNRL